MGGRAGLGDEDPGRRSLWRWEEDEGLDLALATLETSAVKAGFPGVCPGPLPWAQRGSTLSLMLWCPCLEIHNKVSMKGLMFSLCTGSVYSSLE